MTGLRVPHLLHVLPTFVPAGVGQRTVDLVAGFGDRFRHSILALDGRTEAAAGLPEGAPARLLPGLPRAGTFTTARRLRELLRQEEPDLVLTYNWGAFDMLLAARSLRFRRVVHHEDCAEGNEAETFKRRRLLARRAVLSGIHRLIVPSDRLFGIAARLWKVPAAQIALIRTDLPFESLRDAYLEVYQSALCSGSGAPLPEALDGLC